MQVACFELLVSNRIVVFLLFLRAKLGGNVLQITVLYISGHNSRGSGLKTPPHDMNAFEMDQPLLSQISCVPQRPFQTQLLCGCFTPTLSLLCLVHCLPSTLAISRGQGLIASSTGQCQSRTFSAIVYFSSWVTWSRKPLHPLLLILLPLAQRSKEGKEVSLFKCQAEISSFKDKRYGGRRSRA